jgi:hypothetical protein
MNLAFKLTLNLALVPGKTFCGGDQWRLIPETTTKICYTERVKLSWFKQD